MYQESFNTNILQSIAVNKTVIHTLIIIHTGNYGV